MIIKGEKCARVKVDVDIIQAINYSDKLNINFQNNETIFIFPTTYL